MLMVLKVQTSFILLEFISGMSSVHMHCLQKKTFKQETVTAVLQFKMLSIFRMSLSPVELMQYSSIDNLSFKYNVS